ncbi:presqualene diphosphate synthase HpnD [Robbsia sp. Bb-Pol-6]|uniref:Presqualene diphosphate synthase HpnD n=1 Tax=Robbsia betulipollinis TaxID=2981849 RepID=A0ABT3ZNB5_9BURK|nr:presqualene diphosphate synthase HpnD [Robbsia betulipollinis]MCY0388033.1 presqualene diphosphate synthase HpnD [Robbsia betulipollinis]
MATANSIDPIEPREPVEPGTRPAPGADGVNAGDGSPLQARRSSFYLAMRVLPPEQREAMYEIYSFCRAVDDIADGDGERGARRAALDVWRERIDAMYPGTSTVNVAAGPGAVAPPRLAAAVARFDLQQADFVAVIDGMQMDLDADIQAPSFEVLDLYCDRVASAVGRLCTQVFGLPRPLGVKLAHHLGRALQFTNILRDLDEDAAINRLYLARESLIGADIAERTPHAVLAAAGLPLACTWLARAARVHYVEADALMRRAPRATVKAPRLMSAVYRETLEKTVARGWTAPRERVRVSRLRLATLYLRYGFF